MTRIIQIDLGMEPPLFGAIFHMDISLGAYEGLMF
jgi:hypothetical protein